MSVHNWYSLIPKKYLDKDPVYPGFKKVRIKTPFRMILVGASGSGKTNTLVDLIVATDGAFEEIHLFAKNTDQPIYRWLRDTLKDTDLITHEIDEIPAIDEIPLKPALYIFDDLICEGKEVFRRISDLYVQGRHKKVSCMFLTQKFFGGVKTKIIRENTNYIVLKKIPSIKDLECLVSEYSLGEYSSEQLSQLHAAIVSKGFENFLLLDLETNDPKLRYRFNFGVEPLPKIG